MNRIQPKQTKWAEGQTATSSLSVLSACRPRCRIQSCARFTATLLLVTAFTPALPVHAEDGVANEFRQTFTFQHPIAGPLTGSGDVEYRNNPDKNYQEYGVLWPGLTYSVQPWLQLSAGLVSLYTDNAAGADKLELRPFAGVKLFVPNEFQWNFYNYTRYEFRDTQNLDTHDWSSYRRLRSRFGVELPFTARAQAWQPRTWYGLADVEPIYRFDHHTIDPLYVRGGLGYVLNDRVRVEFVYYAEFARATSGALEHADNIFQLNLKIGLAEGILSRLHNPHSGD